MTLDLLGPPRCRGEFSCSQAYFVSVSQPISSSVGIDYPRSVQILVTGGAGFIGSNLTRSLIESGHEVRVLDDLSTGLSANIQGLPLEFHHGSITDKDTVNQCSLGVDAIVHLAARGSVARSIAEPESTHLVNVTGTLNVLEAARSSGAHLVFASSSSVYGSNTKLPKNEMDWTQPISPYGASKLAAEAYTLAYQEAYQLDALALRFFNVYGPFQRPDHDYAAVIPRFVRSGLAEGQVEIHGDGEQSRDFTHVNVVVEVIHQALDQRVSWRRPVNLALGDHISVNGLVDELETQLGRPLVRTYRRPRPGDIGSSRNSPELLRSLFPKVAEVPFSEGLGSVIDWISQSSL